VFWGDTHLHTSYSWDAGLVGARLGPDDAYRFARGEEVTASMGVQAKLVRPLGWLVVADHAESLGVPTMLERADPQLLATEVGRATYDLWEQGDLYGAFETWGLNVILAGEDPLGDPEIARPIWEEITAFADDPEAQAFYYARVIEIPTPRWVLYDKVRLGAEIPEEATLTGQERVYTSPIWYTPDQG
jgi:hypothetical protein